MKRFTPYLRVVAISFAVCYLVSYLGWSRMAFARAAHVGSADFYFVEPDGSGVRHWANRGVVASYFPLIVIDHWAGTGMPPGKEPLGNVT